MAEIAEPINDSKAATSGPYSTDVPEASIPKYRSQYYEKDSIVNKKHHQPRTSTKCSLLDVLEYFEYGNIVQFGDARHRHKK